MPVLQVLLVAAVFLGVFVEIKTGGLGAGIFLALVAAGIFFGSQYVQGLTDLAPVGIFLAGIVCIAIEMVLPTIGLFAAIGLAALIYSLVLALGGDINGVYAMLISLVIAIAIFALVVNRLPSSKLWRKVVLSDSSTSEKGFVSAKTDTSLVGKTGEVISELRPSGAALIDGKPVDVISEGAFIEKGEMVQVISAQGSRVVVRKV